MLPTLISASLAPGSYRFCAAAGSADALAWTKRTLNHWIRHATPTFDSSLAYEMLTFFGPDVEEGERAVREKRRPRFPSAPPAADLATQADR